jgi:predicted transcriptional regulator of viral defense system
VADHRGETPNSSGFLPIDAQLARLAAGQHGVVAIAQLRSLGVNQRGVEYRVRVGRLHRLHRGVYAVGHPILTRQGHFLSAQLAIGSGTLLSRHSAAEFWGFRKHRSKEVHVTTTRDARSRPGIRVHRTEAFYEDDIARQQNIWVTSPARTILDLSSTLEQHQLARALRQAEVDGRLTHDQLRRQIRRHPKAKGRRQLRQLLDEGERRTRSALEDAVAERLRGEGVHHNVLIGGHEVDLYFPDRRLVIEVDSEKYHDTPTSLLLDAEKDRELAARGIEVQRVRQTDPAAASRWSDAPACPHGPAARR